MWFRKLICKVFGHRSRCLAMWNRYSEHSVPISSFSCFQCERCQETSTEQWDH
jgi:hypothetical protein